MGSSAINAAVTDPDQQLFARGHSVGDFFEAYKWKILRNEIGLLEVECHLLDKLRNGQRQLFGGYTPTYVDLVSLYTVHTVDPDRDPTKPRDWLTTINMRCDYFEPIMNDTFVVRGEVVNQRGKNFLISTTFLQDEVIAAHAITTIRKVGQRS
jgi:acyl-coenzyme A thioesterase PaaI-like protein